MAKRRYSCVTLSVMSLPRHPALKNLYTHLGDNQVVAYLDETFDDEVHRSDDSISFYTISAVVYRGKDIAVAREDLKDIVSGRYWHSTDAIQTDGGRSAFVEALKYFGKNGDVSLFVTQAPLPDSKENQRLEARTSCLQNLVSQLADGVTGLRAVVMEKSNKKAHDSRDQRDLKALQSSGRIPSHLQFLHVSPSEEQLLWAPDMVAMAYRRTLTHTDKSSRWFEHIKDHSHVTILDGTVSSHDTPLTSETAQAFLAGQELLETVYTTATVLQSSPAKKDTSAPSVSPPTELEITPDEREL